MPDSAPPSVAAVTVRVVYLARLREAFGMAGEALTLADGEPTVAAVLDALRARGGPWTIELKAGRAFRVAVNHELADGPTVVHDGDEVALFPPVTGG